MKLFLSPAEHLREICTRVKERRIELNITQKELASRSGVSFGSVKRFEQSGEISLKNLIQIAIVLRAIDDFSNLFERKPYDSIDELIEERKSKKNKRAGRNDSRN
jgi:transcriptional regulator with XRE-family HTH domain